MPGTIAISPPSADVVTAKKRLEIQTQQLEQNVVKLDGQARQALTAGREDLARQALERKSGAQQQLQDLDTQVKQLEGQQEKLVTNQSQLSARIEQFRTQKEVIKAQYSAAEAQVRIGEATTGLGEEMSDVGLALSRAQDKTEQMQARAAAVTELVDTGAIEAQHAREKGDRAVEAGDQQEIVPIGCPCEPARGARQGTPQPALGPRRARHSRGQGPCAAAHENARHQGARQARRTRHADPSIPSPWPELWHASGCPPPLLQRSAPCRVRCPTRFRGNRG